MGFDTYVPRWLWFSNSNRYTKFVLNHRVFHYEFYRCCVRFVMSYIFHSPFRIELSLSFSCLRSNLIDRLSFIDKNFTKSSNSICNNFIYPSIFQNCFCLSSIFLLYWPLIFVFLCNWFHFHSVFPEWSSYLYDPLFQSLELYTVILNKLNFLCLSFLPLFPCLRASDYPSIFLDCKYSFFRVFLYFLSHVSFINFFIIILSESLNCFGYLNV